MKKPENKPCVQELHIVKETPPPVVTPPNKASSGDKKFDEAIDRMLFGKKHLATK